MGSLTGRSLEGNSARATNVATPESKAGKPEVSPAPTAAAPAGNDNVWIVLGAAPKQLRKQLRRVLKVCVHHAHIASLRCAQPFHHTAREPLTPPARRAMNQPDRDCRRAWDCRRACRFANHRGRLISEVVDEHDLKPRRENTLESADELSDIRSFATSGNDNRYGRHAARRVGGLPQVCKLHVIPPRLDVCSRSNETSRRRTGKTATPAACRHTPGSQPMREPFSGFALLSTIRPASGTRSS